MIFLATSLLYISFACYAFGILSAFCFSLWPTRAILFGYTFATIGSVTGLAAAILFLREPQSQRLELFTAFRFTNAGFEILIDPLAAFFLLIICLGGSLVSIYAIGYSQDYIKQGKNVSLLVAGYNFFFITMLAVVLANNAFMFLVAWELMSLVSYFLVSFEHEKKEVRKAGVIYIVTTHFGTAFITASFLLLFLAAGQNLSFDAFRAGTGAGFSDAARNAVFLLALIGFGTKAGLMPMHFWLPRAHPVAPSHVSALMSGVMIKTAIYGLVRISFDLLGGRTVGAGTSSMVTVGADAGRVLPPSWWGILLLIVGLVSALLGVLYALVEVDLKKLLAFSSIENMGIICLGLGVALIFYSLPLPNAPALTVLALFAAFFHLLNHTVFKSLLFMGAGAVLHATHTRNLEQLGGLIKSMKWTALFFLAGCLAISALPPFNGFISEWLTFQALLGLVSYGPELWHKVIGLLTLGGLSLTGALAATTFIKAFGTGFLAQPRSQAAVHAHEVSKTMRFGLGLAAALTALLGLGAAGVLALLKPALEQWTGAGSSQAVNPLWSLPSSNLANSGNTNVSGGAGNLNLLILLLPLVLIIVGWGIARLLGGKNRRAIDETWACGNTLKPSMEYNSISFIKPLRRVFQFVLLPFREVKITYRIEPYFVERIEYQSGIKSLLNSDTFRLARHFLSYLNTEIKVIQNGSVRLYLSYILVTLLILLVFTR